MNVDKIKIGFILPALACCLLLLNSADVRADLSVNQARKAITRIGGLELKKSDVRVTSVAAAGHSTANVTADIKTVFKFEADKDGKWQVAEIRTGQGRWERVEIIASALGAPPAKGDCTATEPRMKGKVATDPSVRRARCLLGSLLGIEVPSDAIRIYEVNPMPIPLASEPSATVVAWLRVTARLTNDKSGWHVSELRTGNRDWVKLESVMAAIDEQKQKQARGDLDLIAKALEKFRKDRGFYVVSDRQSVAIDFLSPHYLSRVIRLDPWNQPYKYLGEREHFTLRSTGPDRKADTPDDITLSETRN